MEMEEGQYPHLFNNKLLLRAVCSGHSQGRKLRCTHTHWAPFSTFCWHKPKASQLARSKISFQGRNETPQSHKTASGDSFWGWRMPRQWPPLMTQQSYSSQHIVIPHSGNGVRSPTHFFQAVNVHFYTDNTAQTKAADISKLQSASMFFFLPGKQTKIVSSSKVSLAMCMWLDGTFWMRTEAAKHNILVLKAECCCLNKKI